ncbi:CDP-glycerol glycerophosphotransferase family protein [Aeromonas dhakensis]|uniref:CDP-glycerol glycerophosphotransferase family protein n=1 Tax=Aeromonas dhakensis TaxID=196024 RepID=UPI00191DED5E|nr:CDP-glycerol glycerophosphotransferase family protein [Aeromonas dhakensis]MBL0524405.1 CDP-glycerol glycerophosphotransferase family protein [Aeromonas dhakensis]
MLKRKLKKLVNNPKLFFSDMAIKHSNKISYLKPKRMEGQYQYTVVSAVYNVGRYLDDYFNSLVKQRLDFRKHIHLILVDDGSTDHSAEIIMRWQKKYPNNITYLFKENGGQASARNHALPYVKTEWVTFIDPDDTVERDYFLNIDKSASNSSQCVLLCCNLMFYMEESGEIRNSHPLKYRFQNGDSTYDIKKLDGNIQLSASTGIFKSNIIKNNKILFNPKIRPSFEDAHFVSMYMLAAEKGKISFLESARYLYRKRSDGSSTIDTAWQRPGLFDEVLELGCLDILQKFKDKYGQVPEHIQRAVLYHLIWYFRRLINSPNELDFLDQNQIEKFQSLVYRIFSFIDSNTIESFNLGDCWFFHKVGLLGLLKNEKPKFQIAYISEFDHVNEQVQVRFFSHNKCIEKFQLDNGLEVFPTHQKTISHTLFNKHFLYERYVWINIDNSKSIHIKIDDSNTKITLSNKQYNTKISTSEINKFYTQPQNITNNKYKDSWLFIDRDTQADDNAEHLYRYIKTLNLTHNIYFLLRRESHDWERLKKDGFSLIEFDSEEHKLALKKCSKVISSNADGYITNYLGGDTLKGKHFIFLQHGVIHNDLSSWLNQKNKINCFITSTKPEYESIADESSNYKFTRKEVCLTGLPRHDNLINNKSKEKIILIMPTWRKHIVGSSSGGSAKRKLNPDFINTDFAQNWQTLLNSNELETICTKNNYKVIFFPHLNIQPYIDKLKIPKYIDVVTHSNVRIQELLCRSSLMITDYSSVAFDMAVQGKPVIYFQFDADIMLSGKHTSKVGYFDYSRDGFGPVVNKSSAVIKELETLVFNNCSLPEIIQHRVNSTFPFRDSNNCQRVYDAILKLDKKSDQSVALSTLIAYAESATQNRSWPLAAERWQRVLNISRDNYTYIKYIESLREQGLYTEALDTLSILQNSIPMQDWTQDIINCSAMLEVSRHEWSSALAYWSKIPSYHDIEFIHYMRCLAELEWIPAITHSLDLIKEETDVSDIFILIATAWRDICTKNWKSAIKNLEIALPQCTSTDLYHLKPELMLSRCYLSIGSFALANKYLAIFESHTRNNPQCREEIARLALIRGDYDKVIYQLKQAYKADTDVPEPLTVMMIEAYNKKISEISHRVIDAKRPEIILVKIKSLREQGRISQASSLLEKTFNRKSQKGWSEQAHIEAARIFMLKHDWKKAIAHWEQCSSEDPIVGMARLRCLAELGLHKAIKRTMRDDSWFTGIPESHKDFATALLWFSQSNWIEANKCLSKAIPFYDKSSLVIHKPELWLSRCLREQGLYNEAHHQLARYESHTRNDSQCREQIALLAFARGDMKKVIHQLEHAYPDSLDIPEDLLVIKLFAMQLEQDFQRSSAILKSLDIEKSRKISGFMEDLIKKHSSSKAA